MRPQLGLPLWHWIQHRILVRLEMLPIPRGRLLSLTAFNHQNLCPHLQVFRSGQGTAFTRRAMLATASGDNATWLEPRLRIEGAPEGPLKGLTFAAKDLFDVKGHVTGHGNPTWRETHEPASATAPAVQAALDAGATLVGKTHLDECAFSLNGENLHYGTPRNPACPDRIPGGSSSGSVVVVAGQEVDFALGSDTAGSVRVPASYCGTFGMRPSHGRVSLQGACPLAPMFDTGGWFAQNPAMLLQVGKVLLNPSTAKAVTFKRWLVATDAFKCADEAVSKGIYEAMSKRLDEVTQLLGKPEEVEVASDTELGPLSEWKEVFKTCQVHDAWKALGGWVTEHKPKFGPATAERFKGASKVTDDEAAVSRTKQLAIVKHVDQLLGSDAVMTLPTAPGPAPKLKTPPPELEGFRNQLITLTSIASLAGLPQVSLPVVTVDGCPVGLSLIGPRGSDEALLELAEKLYPLLV